MSRPGALGCALALAAALVVLAGCGEGVTRGAGPLQVVAAEDMWGSIAAQLARPQADVTSIITNPAQDPHAYEPTAVDGRTLATASLAIVNGLDYDPWAGHLLAANPTPGRIVLDVGRLLHLPTGANPHRWYDPADVVAVARAITADLQRLDPIHHAAYAAHLAHFLGVALAPYRLELALISARDAGTPVGASESIFAPLASALHLRLLTPARLLDAVSEGNDLTAGDVAEVTRQLTTRAIRAWVLNVQNTTPEIGRLTALARQESIPVVPITETLVPAGASFEAWQVRQLRALARALRQGRR